MKNKVSFIWILHFLLSSQLIAAEPDESGLGGTGNSINEAETLLDLFHKPDLPERVELPDVIDIPQAAQELGDNTSGGGGGAGAAADTAVSTGTSTGTATSPPP